MRSKISIVAAKEWRDGWRNRWVIAITLVFACMALGISWFGSVANGEIGTASLATTIASLSSLAVIVIPLIALLLGYDAFVSEQDQGTLWLVLSYPISKRQWVLGKFIGQGAILAAATFVGFGSAGLFLFRASNDGAVLMAFAVFIGSATLLGFVFLALAHLLSMSVNEKSRAAGIALGIWFFFTLIYDLGLLSLLVASQGWMDQSLLKTLLLINPTDVFRIINLTQLEAQGSGVLASLGDTGFNMAFLMSLPLIWILISLETTTWIFKTKKL